MFGADNPRWGGDDISYTGVHLRMRRTDPASNHACAHCGGAASQWAYTHDDPNEKRGEEGPYSVDPSHYIPLCASCHIRFDQRRAA